MSIDAEAIDIPQLHFAAVIRLASTSFRRIINELDTFAETVEIYASKDGVRFSAKGNSASGSIMLKQSETADADSADDNVEINVTEEIQLSFALRYLKLFAKASPLSNFVTLRLCDQHPVQVEYQLGEKGEVGHLFYYLAPKISDDEDNDEDGDED